MVSANRWHRLWRNLVAERGLARRAFDDAALARIEQAVRDAEAGHGAEIVVAYETRLSPAEVLRGVAPRDRALAAFAELGVWDTERNSGVLVYLLLAEHAIEIVADRGVAALVAESDWAEPIARVREGFLGGDPAGGLVAGIGAIATLLAQRLPIAAANPNERADRPVRLR
jgi:uncharacterized membrane protein